MARILDLKAHEIKPISKYLVSIDHVASATLGYAYLKQRLHLDVRKVQLQDKGTKTCWYVSLSERQDVSIFYFTITRPTLKITFTRLSCLVLEERSTMKMDNQSCSYRRVSSASNAIPNELVSIMDNYVLRCFEANGLGKLKQGGTSAAETIVEGLLREIGVAFTKGTRPEWIVSPKGKYLQLDFYMVELKIAIEVQGIQHERDIYGDQVGHETLKKNDAIKAEICLKNGISLIRLNAKAIQTELVRRPLDEQIIILQTILNEAEYASDPVLIDWPGDH
jgi:very-short-patch-repair endonuclease